MGSLSGVGVPVVTKAVDTFRKFDRRLIKSADDRVDSDDVVVAQSLPSRPIGSGSIVRDDNMGTYSVEYYEERSWGLYQGGRSTSERIASDSGNARNLNVDRVVPPLVVLPSGDGEPRAYHTGSKIVLTRPSGDEVYARVDASGTFG